MRLVILPPIATRLLRRLVVFALLGCLAFLTLDQLAHAQVVVPATDGPLGVPTMSIDLGPLLTTLLSILFPAVLGLIEETIRFFVRKYNLDKNSVIIQQVQAAADAAAGLAYKYAVSRVGGLSNVDVHDAAVAKSATYMLSTVNDGLQYLNKDPAGVTAMVEARLGKLMAGDPSVSANGPVTATTTTSTTKDVANAADGSVTAVVTDTTATIPVKTVVVADPALTPIIPAAAPLAPIAPPAPIPPVIPVAVPVIPAVAPVPSVIPVA